VDFNNAFFGGTRGRRRGPRAAVDLPGVGQGASRSSPTAPRRVRPLGRRLREPSITKSGTNNLSGSLFYYTQPQSTISDFANGGRAARPGEGRLRRLDRRRDHPRTSSSTSSPTTNRPRARPCRSTAAPSTRRSSPSTRSSAPLRPMSRARTATCCSARRLPGHPPAPLHAAHQLHRLHRRERHLDRDQPHRQLQRPRGSGHRGLGRHLLGQFGANVLNDLNINYITEDTPPRGQGLDLPDFQVTGLGAYGEVSFLPITSTTERKAIGDTLSILSGNHVFKSAASTTTPRSTRCLRATGAASSASNKQGRLPGRQVVPVQPVRRTGRAHRRRGGRVRTPARRSSRSSSRTSGT